MSGSLLALTIDQVVRAYGCEAQTVRLAMSEPVPGEARIRADVRLRPDAQHVMLTLVAIPERSH